ncbi:hypothetical protein SAMN05216358_2719 [Rhizobium sp. AN5]|uniref:hypothetical protein n=1 Tax=Rhizobium sp. AN5 TaxID=1855304 RepID=UPI000BDA59C4|nr:hypothetical protein [Rhizobium sp. AN5]SOC92563.1 hypothetical protein SAMN05216358_2719 [Rhizobium sp. AN5]
MTPAERARQIDKDEFDAECAAIRQRAYSLLGIQTQREARVERWVNREEPKAVYKPFIIKRQAVRERPRGPQIHTVHGVSLTSRQWAERLGISTNAMAQRVHRHGSVIAAILKHIDLNGPGVVSDFERSKGTGAGSTLQETPNITFSGKAENA